MHMTQKYIYSRLSVDKFRRTLPLITVLKNPAMRLRHWKRVKDTIDRDFDETSEDFTLDAIIKMQMHNFAEQISEISSTATMELAVEVVSRRERYEPYNKLIKQGIFFLREITHAH